MRLKKIRGVLFYILMTCLNQLFAQQLFQTQASKVNLQTNSCGIMVNAGPDITICAGVGKNLNGNVVNSVDYSWEPPDGLSNPKIIKKVIW